ncbi:MAG TPA: DoxX family protein [Thermoanaerobaculia bacterium]|nr:DoxX family protein [Thermoanaerobaculia bacterium]
MSLLSTYRPLATAEDVSRAASRPLRRRLLALFATPADPAATVARIALGAMILPHGMQKLFGAFGGYGFAGTMGYFTGALGIPWIFALLAIVAELFGGLGLLLGLAGRLAAFGVGTVMLVAALLSHAQAGFFMNWGGQLPAGQEGWEFHLLAVGLALVVILRGAGSLSADRAIARWLQPS